MRPKSFLSGAAQTRNRNGNGNGVLLEGEQGLSKEQLLIKIRFFAGVAHKYGPRKRKSMSRVSPKSNCSSKFAFLRVLLTNTDPTDAFCSLCLSAAILLSCSQYVPSIYHRCRRNPGSLQDSTGPATGRLYKDKRPVFRASHLHFSRASQQR